MTDLAERVGNRLREYQKRVQSLETLLSNTREKLEAYENALTPSKETKYDYSGEFTFSVRTVDNYFTVDVPWTTIKEIMAAIQKRALDRIHQQQEEK